MKFDRLDSILNGKQLKLGPHSVFVGSFLDYLDLLGFLFLDSTERLVENVIFQLFFRGL